MEQPNILLALALTMVAGLSTGIGSLIAFFAKQTNTRFLSASLGFSAGVMLYVSFMELMPEAVEQLRATYSDRYAEGYMLLVFLWVFF
ncbi:zinc/iron permease [gut metagenome]|uniref:Zinc/iron permease n=1 Tax=gut metagenome TaxID=749906 RepID=J9H3B8_9ZZZZ